MMYSSVLAAVVGALTADTVDNTSKQAWQKLYTPHHDQGGDLCLLGGARPGVARVETNYWLHTRLYSQLSSVHWQALVARYSTHRGKKVGAIGKLVALVPSPAPSLFRYKAVTAWAIPQLKGAQGRRSTDMIVLPTDFYDISTWDQAPRPESTRREWRRKIHAALDRLVEDALDAARPILQAEGVLFAHIA